MTINERFLTEKTMMTLCGFEGERAQKDLDYLVSKRKLPAIRLKGRKKCFYAPDVEKWLLENRIINGSETENSDMQ